MYVYVREGPTKKVKLFIILLFYLFDAQLTKELELSNSLNSQT